MTPSSDKGKYQEEEARAMDQLRPSLSWGDALQYIMLIEKKLQESNKFLDLIIPEYLDYLKNDPRLDNGSKKIRMRSANELKGSGK